MKLRVLGCSGGIGAGLRTTSLKVDHDIMIDAGSGLGDLSLEELSHIKHIFLTHSHLDHIAFIPFLVDSIFERIQESVVIHAQAETIQALKAHIFNWVIWPDFSELPSKQKPVLRFQEMSPGDVVSLEGRQVEMIQVNHVVPAVGYRVQDANGSFAFTGDTHTNDSFWDALNKHHSLDLLISEVSFTNRQSQLANIAKHYCPATLGADLAKLRHRPDIYLTHLKPGEEVSILAECRASIPQLSLKSLTGGEEFQL